MTAPAENNMVWMDLEMSGLDPKTCKILEIASLVTDKDLNVVAQGPALVVHQPEEVLSAMDDWNKHHHGLSGLTEAVRKSAISLEAAEKQTLAFIQQHCPPSPAPFAGTPSTRTAAF